jgi:hypothetical protein
MSNTAAKPAGLGYYYDPSQIPEAVWDIAERIGWDLCLRERKWKPIVTDFLNGHALCDGCTSVRETQFTSVTCGGGADSIKVPKPGPRRHNRYRNAEQPTVPGALQCSVGGPARQSHYPHEDNQQDTAIPVASEPSGDVVVQSIWAIRRARPTLQLLHASGIDPLYCPNLLALNVRRAHQVWPGIDSVTCYNATGFHRCTNPEWDAPEGGNYPEEKPLLSQCYKTTITTTVATGSNPEIIIPHTCVVVRHGCIQTVDSGPGIYQYRLYTLRRIHVNEISLAGCGPVLQFVCMTPVKARSG